MKKFLFLFFILLFSCGILHKKDNTETSGFAAEPAYVIEEKDPIHITHISEPSDSIESSFRLMLRYEMEGIMFQEAEHSSEATPVYIAESAPLSEVLDATPKVKEPNFDTVRVSGVSSRGFVSADVPDDMKVGIEYIISVRVTAGAYSKKKMVMDIKRNNSPETVTVYDIQTDSLMGAELIDTKGTFSIISKSSPEQMVDTSVTEWIWTVKPIKAGDASLRLVLKIFSNIKGKDTVKDLPVFDEVIYIKRNIGYSIKNFISEYWQWLMTTIIIPFIIFLYKRKKSKKAS